jgi:hypothetical protein
MNEHQHEHEEERDEANFQFSAVELKRLAAYRAAVHEGFYNDGDGEVRAASPAALESTAA